MNFRREHTNRLQASCLNAFMSERTLIARAGKSEIRKIITIIALNIITKLQPKLPNFLSYHSPPWFDCVQLWHLILDCELPQEELFILFYFFPESMEFVSPSSFYLQLSQSMIPDFLLPKLLCLSYLCIDKFTHEVSYISIHMCTRIHWISFLGGIQVHTVFLLAGCIFCTKDCPK